MKKIIFILFVFLFNLFPSYSFSKNVEDGKCHMGSTFKQDGLMVVSSVSKPNSNGCVTLTFDITNDTGETYRAIRISGHFKEDKNEIVKFTLKKGTQSGIYIDNEMLDWNTFYDVKSINNEEIYTIIISDFIYTQDKQLKNFCLCYIELLDDDGKIIRLYENPYSIL